MVILIKTSLTRKIEIKYFIKNTSQMPIYKALFSKCIFLLTSENAG
ncbi:hypothetical protein CAMRE0001_0172 [Campylobacter rectus RM3267]|uniref:Uncharacterized protein n=1 Tax=Campylobacter rectus RM3267 TaxID=553218 RepID=B9CXX8_CAMRE|nr:hypothetical protein CAMRE0001_0172 [Campylobacter rectus RM3267]